MILGIDLRGSCKTLNKDIIVKAVAASNLLFSKTNQAKVALTINPGVMYKVKIDQIEQMFFPYN